VSGLSSAEFKLAFRHHAAGVAVITADAGDGPVGLTASSVFSVSAEPPVMVFSISNGSSSAPQLRRAETVVVHLLSARELDIARLCSTSGIDRFADTSIWGRLPTGEPHFPGVPVWIRGRVINRMDVGDSTLIAVHALESEHTDSHTTTPLVYSNRAWHALGDASLLAG
jgi:flavin reductase (DIM6/NTAB) family NADH-FMN oxidoreductase RutF